MRRIRFAAIILPAILLCACGQTKNEQPEQPQATAAPDPNGADSMASNDNTAAPAQATDPQSAMMQAQVVLERLGFGSGIIDGKTGISTENALAGFQEANGLTRTGKLDEATTMALKQWSNIPATRSVTIPGYWGDESYSALPKDPAAQAKLDRLGYQSLDERLAERFHTTSEVLKALNPRADAPSAAPAPNQSYFAAGQKSPSRTSGRTGSTRAM